MVTASFEYEGNTGLLTLVTHFGHEHKVICCKHDGESFRLGGTAVNDVVVYEGIILSLKGDHYEIPFKAFKTESITFEDKGLLSPEEWTEADLHCYVTEYYPLDMEDKKPGWLITHRPLVDANRLFVNLDVLDGGDNLVKRYRVSPFTGQYCIMEQL